MGEEIDRPRIAERAADRLDELAEAAGLMGDEAAATDLRQRAHRVRLDAMAELDE